MDIPEIVKQHVLKHNKRMPETQEEIDQYLDLINHATEFAGALAVEKVLSKGMAKRLGFKTSEEIKKEGKNKFTTHLK